MASLSEGVVRGGRSLEEVILTEGVLVVEGVSKESSVKEGVSKESSIVDGVSKELSVTDGVSKESSAKEGVLVVGGVVRGEVLYRKLVLRPQPDRRVDVSAVSCTHLGDCQLLDSARASCRLVTNYASSF